AASHRAAEGYRTWVLSPYKGEERIESSLPRVANHTEYSVPSTPLSVALGNRKQDNILRSPLRHLRSQVARQNQERRPEGLAGARQLRFDRLLRGAPQRRQVAHALAGDVLRLQGLAVVRRQLRHGGVDQLARLLAHQHLVGQRLRVKAGEQTQQFRVHAGP